MGDIPEVNRNPAFSFLPDHIAIHFNDDEGDFGFAKDLSKVASINSIPGDDRMVSQTNWRFLRRSSWARPVTQSLNRFCAPGNPWRNLDQERRQQHGKDGHRQEDLEGLCGE